MVFENYRVRITSRNGWVGKIKPTGFNNAWSYLAWLSMAHLFVGFLYRPMYITNKYLSDKSNFHFSFQTGGNADFLNVNY